MQSFLKFIFPMLEGKGCGWNSPFFVSREWNLIREGVTLCTVVARAEHGRLLPTDNVLSSYTFIARVLACYVIPSI